MRTVGRLAWVTPVVVRLVIGGMLFVHGLDKLTGGPSGFGQFLGSLGCRHRCSSAGRWRHADRGAADAPVVALLTLELIGAIVLVTGSGGLIAAEGVGCERDLAYIAGFLVLLLLGPGRPSVDHMLGIETQAPRLVEPEPASPRPGAV